MEWCFCFYFLTSQKRFVGAGLRVFSNKFTMCLGWTYRMKRHPSHRTKNTPRSCRMKRGPIGFCPCNLGLRRDSLSGVWPKSTVGPHTPARFHWHSRKLLYHPSSRETFPLMPEWLKPYCINSARMDCWKNGVGFSHVRSAEVPWPSQFAYLEKRSTEYAISTTLHRVDGHLKPPSTKPNDAHVLCRFLFPEYSSAFNNIVPPDNSVLRNLISSSHHLNQFVLDELITLVAIL